MVVSISMINSETKWIFDFESLKRLHFFNDFSGKSSEKITLLPKKKDRTVSMLDVDSLSLKIETNVSGILGENGTEIECSYTRENVREINRVDIMAFNKSSLAFELVASYLPDDISTLLPQGHYLKGRVTLINITQSSTKAVMIFNKLMCIDDTFYKCRAKYTESTVVDHTVFSSNMSIQVQVSPSKPDFLLWNLLITATPVITDGENIACVCSGNVGRPPGKFIFQKYQRKHILPMNYTANKTSIREISDNCSYYRTSNITLQVTAEDNQAVIRCVVVSTLAEEYMYVESEPLDVKFAVKMPTIVKHPNKTDYLVGLDTSISLNCTTDGNPKPNYLWYKDNQIEAISTRETFTIANVTTTNSGIYTCFVSNIFNDVIHTQRIQVHVSIIKEANEAPSSTFSTSGNNKTPVIKESNNENTAVIVVGTICGSIILVLCVILFGVIQNKNKMFRCHLIRNHNDRSIDYVNTTQQQNPSLYEGVDHALDVHNYEQLSRREHLYNNANFSNN